MSGPLAVIQLTSNAEMQSQANGTPNLQWCSTNVQQLFCGARSMQIHLNIQNMSDDAKFRIVAQRSTDGFSWQGLSGPLAVDSQNWRTSSGQYVETHVGLPEEFAPFVRIGFLLESTVSSLAEIRFSATAVVLDYVVGQSLGLVSALQLTHAAATGYTSEAVTGSFDNAVVTATITARSVVARDVRITAQTCTNGTDWVDAGAPVTILAAATLPATVLVPVNYVGLSTRLFMELLSSSPGDTATLNASGFFQA
jgi:hypothetical protein